MYPTNGFLKMQDSSDDSAVSQCQDIALSESSGLAKIQCGSLTRDEEHLLGWAVRNDNCHASRLRLVEAHRAMVPFIASKYSGRGLPLGQLYQIGDVGLLRAVEHFDPAQGARFSTLASWWIKQSIKHGLKNASQRQETPCRRNLSTDHLTAQETQPIERPIQHPKAFARQGEM